MEKKYANEQNVLLLVALLKAHGIKRVIASPGTTNLSFVASLQYDSFFEMYSCVDERSAAYMAVGMAAETNEPVVITCTGATASRNYLSALTEAYYRKLPILVVTGTQNPERIGQLHSQLIDRRVAQNDVLVSSYMIDAVRDMWDSYFCQLKINQAIDDLTKNGGGPVHINLKTGYTWDFSVAELPEVKIMKRIGYDNIQSAPSLPNGRIGIFVGSHNTFTPELTDAIDDFCSSCNAVVFCDHTSGYYGKYKVNFSLVTIQKQALYDLCELDLCIHIGEISAEYGCLSDHLQKKEVWRVSPDGIIRDQFTKLTYLFNLNEADFFRFYTSEISDRSNSYYLQCKDLYATILSKMPDIPFSNVWVASILAPKLPQGSCLHLGILNSTRTWNMFELPETVTSFANVGGFGIDGGVSSLIGASFVHKSKLYFGVVGDLAFFYDMNSLGNHHIKANVRLLVVNNGRGTEFRNFYHVGSTFGDDADKFIAAGGHFGNKSKDLVRHFAEDLGFEYITASSKDEFLRQYQKFINPEIGDKPILFEIFTDSKDESDAIERMWNIDTNAKGVSSVKSAKLNSTIRSIVGRRGIQIIKMIMGRK